MPIKLGDTVRQIQPAPIQGVVVKKQFDESSDEFQFLVEGTNAQGEPTSNWFNESQIEGV